MRRVPLLVQHRSEKELNGEVSRLHVLQPFLQQTLDSGWIFCLSTAVADAANKYFGPSATHDLAQLQVMEGQEMNGRRKCNPRLALGSCM